MTLSRRSFVAALAATGAGCATRPDRGGAIFDAHCHIIDHRYPIIENQGYTPPHFPLDAYLAQARPLGVRSGAIVSGSFQGFDQSYLRAVLPALGPDWVGVTQVAPDIPDAEMRSLAAIGVRALRFNLYRGNIASVDDVVSLARRAFDVAGWHAEIYADAAALAPHAGRLAKLPRLVIDHLGMTRRGLPALLDLVDAGARVKATGFGRVDLDVPAALEAVARRSPDALVFGTDIPSTRARRPFMPSDIQLVRDVLGEDLSRRALWSNGRSLYRLPA